MSDYVFDIDQFLQSCLVEGKTIEGLMEEYEISRAEVHRRRQRLRDRGHDIPNLNKGVHGAKFEKAYNPPRKPWDDVRDSLGNRLKECAKRGLVLDGRPVTVQQLMQECGA